VEIRLKSRVTLAALALGAAAPVFGDTYVLDPTHTFPGFEVLHGGFSIQRGSFLGATGKVTLDMAAKKGSIDATIDAASIDTRMPARDAHLKSEGWFDVAKYPTLTFKSTNLKFDGDRLVGADGELTMHGVTKPVHLTVTNFKCGQSPFNRAKEMCGAEVSATIQRSEWGVKAGIPTVGDEVRIAIPIEAYKE
jgi:polyisoprenoid-binding protein YceI